MTDNIVKTTTTELDVPLNIKKVQALLGCIPRQRWHFMSLRLVHPSGNRFCLSIQASWSHYCHPKTNLPKITDYESVELGIIPDERNEDNQGWRFGAERDGWFPHDS